MFLFNYSRESLRRAAYLALLAMLLPTLVSIFHHPDPKMSRDGKMELCALMSGADTKPTKPSSPSKSEQSCPICQTMHLLSGGFLPQVPLKFVTVSFEPSDPLYFDLRSFSADRAVFGIQPRAPPSLA